MTLQEITEALQEWFIERTGSPLDPNESYAAVGRLDSFEVVELVTFSEERFGFMFETGDLERPDFTTLSGLASLIEAKVRAASAP